MKGITHFAAGIAAVSFLPQAVQAGATGNPLYFLLGGICGLLPDTLDFKFARFFYRHDIEVSPDPLQPDAQMIADAVALAVNTAWARRIPVRLKLNTVRLGPDAWQRYEVTLNVRARRVEVRLGPVVDTGRQATAPRRSAQPMFSPLDCDITLDYLARTVVDIFDGPVFAMTPRGQRGVQVGFLPWHRAWSHSLVIGLLPALGAAAAWDGWAGAAAFCGYGAHVALDQIGFMGSNMLYPFTARRVPGLRWVRSGEAAWNGFLVWGCCLTVFWNLSRWAPLAPTVDPVKLFFYGLALPLGARLALRRAERRSPA